MDKSFKKRIPPPGGGWDAFILFWTAVVAAELAYPHIFVEDSEAVKIFRLADFAACVFFLIDVAWRYLSAADKIGFWKWWIVDLISAIAFITVLRYGRIISAARIMLSARQRGKWTAIPPRQMALRRAKSSRNRIIQKLFQIFPSNKILDILHPKFRPIFTEIELKGNFMKISYCRTLIYSLVTAASAIAANAENLSLITGENKALTDTGWNWSDTSKWSPTVSEVAGNDLTIDAVTTTEITSTISDGFTAGDVNIILNQNAPAGSSGGHGHFFLNIDGNATFDNFTWKTTSAQWWGSYIKIKTGSTLTIRNDLTLGNSASNAYFISFIPGNDINYKGNLRIEGDINYYANGSSSNALWTGLNSLTVKGAVSMINQNGNIGKWEIENNNTTIGGLSGADTSNNTIFLRKDTAITFTNSGDYSWNGSINSEKLFDIAMDASATGKQTIKLTDGAINNLTLNGGKFVLASAKATTGKLYLNGGYFGAANNSTVINSAQWNSGGLLFDMAAIENGYKISIAGVFSKNADGQIEINFDGLNGAVYIGDTFELISAGSLDGFNLDDANADFAAVNLLNAIAEFSWNDGTLSVTFGQIPEPAAVAMLLGAAVLFFALRRKRA